MNTDNSLIFFERGNNLYKGKLYKEALEEYKKATEEDVTSFNAHFCVSKTLVRLNKADEAKAHFVKYFHLIPEQKRSKYLIGFVKILNESNFSNLALELINKYDDLTFNEEQIIQIIKLNLINSKIDKSLHLFLKLPIRPSSLKIYNNILENEEISKNIREEIKKKNTIPEFYKYYKCIKILNNAKLGNKKLENILISIKDEIRAARKDVNANYEKSLENLKNHLSECHTILSAMLEAKLKAKQISKAKLVLDLLLSTGFDENKLNSQKQILQEQGEKKKKRLIRTYATVIITLVGLVLISYFTYYYYEKSTHRDKAIKSNTINSYTSYLNKYGDDEKINDLLEEKIYKLSKSTNDAKYYNLLSSKFPKSDKLKTVSISNNLNASESLFGIGSNVKLKKKNNKYFVPIGCKIKYLIFKEDKITISKSLKVYYDMNIKEVLTDSKEILLYDNFNNNTNSWSTTRLSKKIRGKIKYRGINLTGGNLQLYNEFSEDIFILNTIPIPTLNEADNFTIEASITRNGIDKGTFLLFGAGNRAFNYIGISKRGTYDYGYNDWENPADKWVSLNNGWKGSNSVYRGSNPTHILKLIKHDDNINISINGKYLSNMPLKRWYGNRVGFGINNNTKANVNYLKIIKSKKRYPVDFKNDYIYYCWLEELNIRDTASVNGKILTTIKQGDPVLYLGVKGNTLRKTTFNGIYSPDYYYKVMLANGKIGWVHGGALKQITTQNISDSDLWKMIRENN